MEVGDAVESLNILNNKANLSVSLGLVTSIEVGKIELEDSSLQCLRSDFYKTEQATNLMREARKVNRL